MSRLVSLAILASTALLAVVMIGGCSGGVRPATDLPAPEDLAQETTQTSVFYSTGRSLLEERKVVDSTRIYEATLEELLLAYPESNPNVAIVQPAVTAAGVTFSGGVVTIDWPAEILDFEAEDGEERIALASILTTFGQFDEVEKVQFTVEGKASGEASNGKDVEAFWGSVSLTGQPWDVIRLTRGSSDEASSTP
ncbi:MAG: GerMN domain-containing protein [Coriobacteriia bacterium]|nr:GerMN domain-containing protein [Coriobacteriia bacterium]